jgi:NAD(P)-dependent dehydrogenase (short-subunit alcohol dehydrogenase family)
MEGKIAIVTGAGRGIGRQIAITLSTEGAKVGVNDYYLERAEAVAREIKEAGGEAVPIQADVTNMEAVESMVHRVVQEWGRLDILVNNAGVPAGILESGDPASLMRLFMETDRRDWDKWIDLDFIGVLNCCKAVLKHMTEQKYGKIISIISDAGRFGEPRQAVYSGAKAAVVSFSKALAREIARHGINVNCVAPSATTGTGLSEAMGTDSPKTDQEKAMVGKMMALYPLSRAKGRLGNPSDLANAVAFFASDVSEWITGEVLSVNGGYCMTS